MGESSTWGASEGPGEEVYLAILGLGGNFVWCLIIAVKFVGLAGT